VAHRESELPGISLDVLSASFEGEDHLPVPGQYCHINLPRNPVVIERIMQYLTSPSGKNNHSPMGNRLAGLTPSPDDWDKIVLLPPVAGG
jgi:hypothetical protein